MLGLPPDWDSVKAELLAIAQRKPKLARHLADFDRDAVT